MRQRQRYSRFAPDQAGIPGEFLLVLRENESGRLGHRLPVLIGAAIVDLDFDEVDRVLVPVDAENPCFEIERLEEGIVQIDLAHILTDLLRRQAVQECLQRALRIDLLLARARHSFFMGKRLEIHAHLGLQIEDVAFRD